MPDETDRRDEARNGQDEEEESKEVNLHMLERIWNLMFQEKAAAWTAIFTAVLAVFSYLLFQANSDANKAAIATQRAFITFAQTYFEPVPSNPKQKVAGYRLHMVMSNGGTTATEYSTYEMSIAIQDTVPDPQTNFDALPQSERFEFVFGPRQVYDGLGTYVSLSDLEDVAQEKKHMFFWGWVVYRDVFSATPIRLSEFCLNMTNPQWQNPDHSGRPGLITMSNLPCRQTHNCYDENCQDYSKRIEGFR
jgi:hypothetical protein